jgi:hypothetical protein
MSSKKNRQNQVVENESTVELNVGTGTVTLTPSELVEVTNPELNTDTVEPKQTAKTPAEWIAHFGNVSGAIRGLLAMGYERKVVAKMLEKRYQHVRNVAITPVKKSATVVG